MRDCEYVVDYTQGICYKTSSKSRVISRWPGRGKFYISPGD